MFLAAYIFYAFVQGILVVRGVNEKTVPGFLMIVCLIGAPIVSGIVAINYAVIAFKFLITVGK